MASFNLGIGRGLLRKKPKQNFSIININNIRKHVYTSPRTMFLNYNKITKLLVINHLSI